MYHTLYIFRYPFIIQIPQFNSRFLPLFFAPSTPIPSSSRFSFTVSSPLPIAITKMDESHFSPSGLIKIARAERNRERREREREKKQRARETAELWGDGGKERGEKKRERDMGQLYHREEGGGRVECNVPALYAYAICPPTFPTLRSSIANILHRHRRFDPRSPSLPRFSAFWWDSRARK